MANFPTDPVELRQDLLARVESIRDILVASAPESERLRTLAPSAVAAFASSGLWLFKSPLEVGGEADPLLQMDVIEAVTALDPSAGWCLFIGASVVGSASARLSEQGLAEVWAGEETPRDGRFAAARRPSNQGRRRLPRIRAMVLEQWDQPRNLGKR